MVLTRSQQHCPPPPLPSSKARDSWRPLGAREATPTGQPCPITNDNVTSAGQRLSGCCASSFVAPGSQGSTGAGTQVGVTGPLRLGAGKPPGGEGPFPSPTPAHPLTSQRLEGSAHVLFCSSKVFGGCELTAHKPPQPPRSWGHSPLPSTPGTRGMHLCKHQDLSTPEGPQEGGHLQPASRAGPAVTSWPRGSLPVHRVSKGGLAAQHSDTGCGSPAGPLQGIALWQETRPVMQPSPLQLLSSHRNPGPGSHPVNARRVVRAGPWEMWPKPIWSRTQ
eukprot:XP_022278008.1 collagen alpha-1(II) chain-like isoform X1 [Canis lupus familiaris]